MMLVCLGFLNTQKWKIPENLLKSVFALCAGRNIAFVFKWEGAHTSGKNTSKLTQARPKESHWFVKSM